MVSSTDLESSVNQLSTNVVLFASILLIALVLLALWVTKAKKKKLKLPVFVAMALLVTSTTLTISGATIYLNIKSATGGPVHWHADFEVWACGNELELRDPRGVLSNKIGTPTLHGHNDKRIHLEGVPVSLPHDVSLGKFMNVVGGEINKNTLVVPINDKDFFENGPGEEDGDGNGAPNPSLLDPFIKTERDGKVASFVSGQACGNNAAEVQVFVYNFDPESKTYTQTKLTNPAEYAIARESEVPPGDCVIFEFDTPKDRTSKLCKQYGVRDKVKCGQFGVTGDGRKICENTEVR
ncbi:MAG TPA: hypothetical protein VFT87_02800 [Candidatus Saccharimonadales bacterium]|nr:hypothetical protein [Candidatus Saccharimonadales bacterium]